MTSLISSFFWYRFRAFCCAFGWQSCHFGSMVFHFTFSNCFLVLAFVDFWTRFFDPRTSPRLPSWLTPHQLLPNAEPNPKGTQRAEHLRNCVQGSHKAFALPRRSCSRADRAPAALSPRRIATKQCSQIHRGTHRVGKTPALLLLFPSPCSTSAVVTGLLLGQIHRGTHRVGKASSRESFLISHDAS